MAATEMRACTQYWGGDGDGGDSNEGVSAGVDGAAQGVLAATGVVEGTQRPLPYEPHPPAIACAVV